MMVAQFHMQFSFIYELKAKTIQFPLNKHRKGTWEHWEVAGRGHREVVWGDRDQEQVTLT